MIIDRDKLFYLFMIVIELIILFLANVNGNQHHHHHHLANVTNVNNDRDSGQPEARSFFSPRIDYNEWMPVGRGDPLKNDPTYDYSPPVLDRVRYWGDTNKDKKEILLLGVPSKRQNHKKETNNNSTYTIRRNYYPLHTSLHHLPTRLMPPPVQTIAPTTKQTSTEPYYNLYSQSPSYSQPSHSWSINTVHYDSHPDESINFVSLTRPEGPSNSKPSMSNYGQYFTTSLRKPWIYELLQKEITKPSFSSPSQIQLSSSSLSPQTSSSSNYIMTPSKSIFESHSSIEPENINSFVTPSLTTEEPEPTYFQPTIPPTPASIDSHAFASYKKKQHHEINSIHGPMYLIIQGHSKVKTYGLKDNDTNDHQPKIVPVAPKEEAITKHIVSKDDNGKAVEVKHLHKKTIELSSKEKFKAINVSTTTTTTKSPSTSTTTTTITTEEPSSMKSLLSLLDASFGNFFLNNLEDEHFNTINKTTTTIKMTTTTTKPPSTSNDNKNNCSTSSDTNNDIRERRQIFNQFDYDQLPQSSIFQLEAEEEYYEDKTQSNIKSENPSVRNESKLNSTKKI